MPIPLTEVNLAAIEETRARRHLRESDDFWRQHRNAPLGRGGHYKKRALRSKLFAAESFAQAAQLCKNTNPEWAAYLAYTSKMAFFEHYSFDRDIESLLKSVQQGLLAGDIYKSLGMRDHAICEYNWVIKEKELSDDKRLLTPIETAKQKEMGLKQDVSATETLAARRPAEHLAMLKKGIEESMEKAQESEREKKYPEARRFYQEVVLRVHHAEMLSVHNILSISLEESVRLSDLATNCLTKIEDLTSLDPNVFHVVF